MIVSCPSCQSRFRVPDGHAGQPGLRFRCTNCGSVFALGAASASDPGAPQTGGSPSLPSGHGFGAGDSAPGSSRSALGTTPPPAPRNDRGSWDEPTLVTSATSLPRPRGAELDSRPNPGVGDAAPEGSQSPFAGAGWTRPAARPRAGAPLAPEPSMPAPHFGAPPSLSGSSSTSGLFGGGSPEDSELPDDIMAFARVRRDSSASTELDLAGAPPLREGGPPPPPRAAVTSGDSRARSVSSSFEALLDGDGGFQVAEHHTDSGSIPVDDAVRSQIDPMVEFHDVFQDIRRAEKGVPKEAPPRYIDPEILEPSAPRALDPVPQEPEDRFKTGRLNLKAGGLEEEIARTTRRRPSERDEDSDIVAAALAESGIAEPSPAEIQRARQVEEVAALDLSGDAHLRGETYLGAARALGALVVVLLCLAGALGYMAAKNDGLLDLKAPDQMIGVAFQGQQYVPRVGAVAPVTSTVEVTTPTAPDAIVEPSRMEVGELQAGVYEASHGGRFAVVDGVLFNRSDTDYRHVVVEVVVTDPSGTTVAARSVPVAARLEQPAFEASRTAEDLEAHYVQLAERVADVTFGANAETVFSAAFLLDEGVDAATLTYDVRLGGAERRADACWVPVEFRDGAPAEPAAPDAATAPAQAGEAADG